MGDAFAASWSDLGATAITVVAAYVAVVVLLRVAGKRTLAKLNAFDFVVTIALGSTLASVIVSRTVPLAEGVLALAGLVVLQYGVAWSARRWPSVSRAVTERPTAVLVDGQLRPEALDRCRVRVDELAAAVRKKGAASFEDVDLVVLETDGTFSVLAEVGSGSALDGVDGC